MTMTVYIMNENLQFKSENCWTGATAGSNNVYKLSELFPDLENEKRTLTVYSK